MSTNGSEQPELTGEVLFYKQPEPLSLQRHRLLGVKQVERPFSFLRESHVAPLTAHEMATASSSYPIIFAGPAKAPLAVMGARAGENLFITPDGLVDPEVYLPFFARRYPFVFAAEPNGDKMVLCIDRAAPMIAEGAEVPLFNGDEPSKFTNDAMEFCKEFERYRAATITFVQRVTDMDLWDTKDISITPTNADGSPGEPILVAEFYAISEKKLNELPPEKFLQLRSEGWLVPIYAHLMSQLLWPKILNRAMSVLAAEAEAAQRQQQGAAPAR